MDRSVTVSPGIRCVEIEVTVCAGSTTVGPLIVENRVTICVGATTVDPLIVENKVTVEPSSWIVLVETIVEAGSTTVELDTGKVVVTVAVLADVMVLGGRVVVKMAVEVR